MPRTCPSAARAERTSVILYFPCFRATPTRPKMSAGRAQMDVLMRFPMRSSGFSTMRFTRPPDTSTTPYFEGRSLSATRMEGPSRFSRRSPTAVASMRLSPGSRRKSSSMRSRAAWRAWAVPSCFFWTTYSTRAFRSLPSSKWDMIRSFL